MAERKRLTERGKTMCEACKELSKVWDASQELLVTHVIGKKTGLPLFVLVQGNKNPQTVTIFANFCPWCGRKLEHRERSEGE